MSKFNKHRDSMPASNHSVEEHVSAEGVENEVVAKPVIGTVSNCNHLNIRKEPCIPSDIIAVIPSGTTVVIDMDRSTEGWYSVVVDDCIEGFCMNCYVTCE